MAARASAASFLAIPIFLALFVITSVLWRVPTWVGLLYVGMSMLCFIAYNMDKRAARRGQWRISERQLLGLGLLGGWPGAIVAQQFLRHKSSKGEFLRDFRVTVALNLLAYAALFSPWGKSLWAPSWLQ